MLRGLMILVSFWMLSFYGWQVAAVSQIPKVVVGTKSAVSTWTVSSSTVLPILTITQQQIQQTGAENVQQMLLFSGLQVDDLGEGGTQATVNMRGFGSNASANMLILFNGNPLTTPDMGSFDINQVPLNLVKKINVYYGSQAIRYGNQAVGGVINIITLPIGKAQQSLGFGFGSYNTRKVNGNFVRKLSKQDTLRFNFFHRDSNNYRQHNDLNNTHLDLGWARKLTNGDFNIEYQFSHQRLQYPGYAPHPSQPQQAKNDTDFSQENIHDLQLNYRRDLTPNWQFKINSLLNFMTGAGILSLGSTPHSNNTRRRQIDVHPSITGILNVDDKSIITTSGVAVNNGTYDYKNDMNAKDNTTQTIYSAFTQFNIPLRHAWSLLAGARYAHGLSSLRSSNSHNPPANLNIRDHVFVTRIGLSWQIKPDLRFYVRRAGNYRFPKTDEQLNLTTGAAVPLNVQTGVSYETGLSWLKAKWTGLLSVYRLNLDNEIATRPVTGGGVENTNLAPTYRQGTSLHLNYTPWKKLTLGVIYHYVDAHFSSGLDKGNRIPFVAENRYSLAAIYRIKPHWTVMLQSAYTGSQTFANDPSEHLSKISAYTVYNANIRYQYKRLTFNLRLNNILDKKYFAYALYNQYVASNKVYYPAMGRNFMLNCTIQL